MHFQSKIAFQARTRQMGRCAKCGSPLHFHSEKALRLIPESRAGKPTLDNCVILCGPCYSVTTGDGSLSKMPVGGYYRYTQGFKYKR